MVAARRFGFALAMLVLLVRSSAAVMDPTTGLDRTPSSGATRPQTATAAVLWDLTHGVLLDYQPSGVYTSLVALLGSNGIGVATTAAGVDHIDLSAYGALVISVGSSWNSSYTASEVAAIKNFVGSGRGLLVMGDNTDTHNNNINPVSNSFGTTCGISYLEPDDLFFSNHIQHPIFAGVTSIYYRAAGELAGVSPSVQAAFTDGGAPTVTTVNPCGVVVTGDVNFCDNNYIGLANNRQFALNIFQWLLTGCATPVQHTSWGHIQVIYR
jgi:hypothetical protein